MKFVALIPARLNSKRLPNKVLHLFKGLPMIEHIRRRVLLVGLFKEVLVITGDKKIAQIITKNKGKVFINKKRHTSGTSRCAELARKISFRSPKVFLYLCASAVSHTICCLHRQLANPISSSFPSL